MVGYGLCVMVMGYELWSMGYGLWVWVLRYGEWGVTSGERGVVRRWGVGSLPSAAEAGLTGSFSPTRIFLATTRLWTFARVTWGSIYVNYRSIIAMIQKGIIGGSDGQQQRLGVITGQKEPQ